MGGVFRKLFGLNIKEILEASSSEDEDDEDKPVPAQPPSKKKKKAETPAPTKRKAAEDEESSDGEEESPAKKPKADEAAGGESATIFVGGLSFDAGEEDVKEFFSDCGNVINVRLPIHQDTSKIKGFAFIEFDSAAAANKAIEKDGQDMMGRWLKISLATGQTPKKNQTPLKRDLSEKPEGCTTVFVGNLSWTATEEEIRSVFEDCGAISNVRIAWDRDEDRAKGFCHVDFEDESAVDMAVKKTGTDISGRTIRVDYAGQSIGGGGGGGGRGRGGGFGGGRGGSRGRGAPAFQGRKTLPLGRLSREPRLASKVCVISGASRGFGQAIAVRFVEEGAKVVLLSRSPCTETMTDISKIEGISRVDDVALWCACDLAHEQEIQQAVALAVAKFGDKIDVLVNNAATFIFRSVEYATAADWDSTTAVNIRGHGLLTKHVLPYMKNTGGGSIVFQGSISSFLTQPDCATYSVVKAAIVQMARNCAYDFAKYKIRVNSVCAGTIETPISEEERKEHNWTFEEWEQLKIKDVMLRRVGHVREVANATLFFACEESSSCTAAHLMVDGDPMHSDE